MSTLVRISDGQMRDILRAEGCDCSEKQWSRRGDHCTTQWIRCNGRMRWKRRNDPEYQRGLARLGHSHPKGQRRDAPCQECERWLRKLFRELNPKPRRRHSADGQLRCDICSPLRCSRAG